MVSSRAIPRSQLDRRYEHARLGQTAIRVQDRILERAVYLKVAPGDPGERLLAEARVLSRLSHRNLVPLHELIAEGRVGDTVVWGFATPAFDGAPFPDGVATLAKTPLATALAGLVDCVAYIHQRGFLHLDLKPDNVLWADHHPLVIDLGVHQPVDAGRGAVGGTWGYTAKEILDGDAPSTATDVYALGRLFNDVARLRKGRPTWLAQLARQMAHTDVHRRPRLAEIRAELGRHGAPSAVLGGAPPFVGRERELGLLARWSGRRHACLWGSEGSGRRRLARTWLHGEGPGTRVDLIESDDPAVALCRLEALGMAEGARVVCGPRERVAPADVEAADVAIERLAEVGASVMWIAQRPIEGAWNLQLGPLSVEDSLAVAAFVGVPASSVHANRRHAVRFPGDLVAAGVPDGSVRLTPAAKRARDFLLRLPLGIPADVVARLPEAIDGALPELEDNGAARFTDGGDLYVRGATALPQRTPPKELAGEVDQPEVDALWRALLAAAFERWDVAERLLPAAVGAGAERAKMLEALCAGLAARGVEGARLPLAESLAHQGLFREVVEQVEHASDRKLRLLHARALRELDLPRSRDVAVALAQETNDADAWLSAAQSAVRLRDWTEVRAFRHRAAAAGAARERLLDIELFEAIYNPSRIAAQAVLDQLGPQMRADLPAATQSKCGRLLARLGHHDEAVRWFLHALADAERSGDLPQSAGIRHNLAVELARMGRADRARPHLELVMAQAERMHAARLLLQAYVTFVTIETQLDRLPSARAALEALQEMAAQETTGPYAHRAAVVEAILLLREGHADRALAAFERLPPPQGTEPIADHFLALAEAQLACDRPSDALETVARLDEAALDAGRVALAASLRGGALQALGREEHHRAREVMSNAKAMPGWIRGRVLLAAAGEGIDPATMAWRRDDLYQAAELLHGNLAARATAHHDVLNEGPSAELATVAAILEATGAIHEFPRALAKLLTEAFRANRALVVAQLPGMGRQTAHTAMGEHEVTQLTVDLLAKLQKPDDYVIASDAYADERLRNSSKTVQTFQIRSILAVPIVRGDDVIGLLYVDDKKRRSRFDMGHVRTLQRLGRAVGHLVTRLGGDTTETSTLVQPVDAWGLVLPNLELAKRVRTTVWHVKATGGCNVLLTGPTGVGKTYFAERLAREVLGLDGLEIVSLRGNDAAMLVSQLFGTTPGDFTGAQLRAGAVERALKHKRALFIDEIQSIDTLTQHVLLPLLDSPRRVGGHNRTDRPLREPLYVILATNHAVTDLRWREQFRADLWYRMVSYHVDIPALAERGPEVIYSYMKLFLAPAAPENVFEADALEKLTHQAWPGNVREVQTLCQRAASQWKMEPARITLPQLAQLGFREEAVARSKLPLAPPPDPREAGSMALREHLLAALEQHDWKQTETAEALGWAMPRLNKWLTRLGLRDRVKESRATAKRRRR